MERVLHNKSFLHRMIALVMAVVMALTLVAIDSHFHLFAEEDIETINITDMIKGDTAEMVSGFPAATKFKLICDSVEGKDNSKIMYKEYTGDPVDKLGTATDAAKYSRLGNEEELKAKPGVIRYAFYYPVILNGKETGYYDLIGTLRVSVDGGKPVVDNNYTLRNADDRLIQKDGYYILDTYSESTTVPAFEVSASDDDSDKATGVDRVVYIKDGVDGETALETEGGKYIFKVPDASGTYRFKSYDKAGNESELSAPVVIKKLNGLPEITAVTTSAVKKTVNSVDYIVSRDTIKVNVTVKNSTAGEDNMQVGAKLCYKFVTDDSESTEMTKAVVSGKASFEIPASMVNDVKRKEHGVVLCVEDELGNRTYWRDLEGNIVFVDDGKPEVLLTNVKLTKGNGDVISYADAENKWANSLELGIAASNDYSYIDRLYYSYKPKNGSDSGDKVIEDALFDYHVESGMKVVGTGKSDDSRSAIALADGQYTVSFKAKTYTGVEGRKNLEVYIDNTAPEAKLTSTASKTKVGDTEYYSLSSNKDQMKITWDDAGYSGVDTSSVTARLVKIGSQGKNQNLGVVIDDENGGHVSINDDTQSGEYELVVSVADNAGNTNVVKAMVFVNKESVSSKISASANGTAVVNGSHVSAGKVVITATASGYALTEDDVILTMNDADAKGLFTAKSVNGKENTITFTYTVTNKNSDMQGIYDVRMTVKKHGTDITEDSKFRFGYDTDAPTISVRRPAEYQNKNVRLSWTAQDNMKLKNIIIEGTRRVYSYNSGLGINDVEEFDVSDKLDGTVTSTVFNEDGRYELSIWAVDNAGNKSIVQNVSFVIDREAPRLEYEAREEEPSPYRTHSQTIDFVLYDSYGLNASDIVLTEHYRTYDGTQGTKNFTFKRKNANTLVATVSLKELKGKATRYSFTITGKDLAGNTNIDQNGLNTVRYYIDETAPDVEINPQPEDKNRGYYNKSVSFDILIKEQFNLKHTLTIKDINGNVDDLKNEFEYNDYTYGVSYSKQGRYNLNIEVTDACGNIMTTDAKFVIDKTKPVVSLGRVNTINNSNVTLPVTLTDNMMGSKYKIHVVRTDASGNKVYEGDQETGNWSGTSFTRDMTFSEEGDYEVTVSAEDKAGNKSDAQTVKFRIDKTAPVISISGMNDRQTTAVTAVITIDEAFSFAYEGSSLGASDISAQITRKTDGSTAANVASLSTSSFSGGNPHTASYSCTEDGEYTITVNARDLAGNVAASATKTFKIDAKAPVLKVSAVDRDSKAVNSYDAIGSADTANPNYVDMSLSVEEAFFSTDKVDIKVKKDGKDVSSEYFANYSNSSTVSTGSQRFSEDGVYEISVAAQDELGNKADDYSMVFTVDNTAPSVDATKKLLEFMAKSTAGEDGSVLLNAEDFADIKNEGYSALWDVNDTSVFTVDTKMDGVDLIDFSDMSDGYHKIVTTVTDEVGHTTVQEFEFTYDGTAPRIIITGVEDGDTVRDPFNMTISLEDENDEITSIEINGNTIDPSQYKNNKYEMQVQEYDTYEIKVTATDKAGNIASTFDEDTGSVFTFTLSEKMSPVMLIIIIIAAILLIALLIFVIIAGRKKKRKAA